MVRIEIDKKMKGKRFGIKIKERGKEKFNIDKRLRNEEENNHVYNQMISLIDRAIAEQKNIIHYGV